MKTYITSLASGVSKEIRRHPLDDVETFFASEKYTMARLTNGKEVFVHSLVDPAATYSRGSSTTLNTIEEWLGKIGNRQFSRIHRAWIANLSHVQAYRQPATKAIGGGELITDTNRKIPVSRRSTTTAKRLVREGVTA